MGPVELRVSPTSVVGAPGGHVVVVSVGNPGAMIPRPRFPPIRKRIGMIQPGTIRLTAGGFLIGNNQPVNGHVTWNEIVFVEVLPAASFAVTTTVFGPTDVETSAPFATGLPFRVAAQEVRPDPASAHAKRSSVLLENDTVLPSSGLVTAIVGLVRSIPTGTYVTASWTRMPIRWTPSPATASGEATPNGPPSRSSVVPAGPVTVAVTPLVNQPFSPGVPAKLHARPPVWVGGGGAR